MNRNRFNAEVRPHLIEIPIGKQGIGFDRLDLDAGVTVTFVAWPAVNESAHRTLLRWPLLANQRNASGNRLSFEKWQDCGKAPMAGRKQTVERPYPPDYVSAETLAYRLDCSRSTVDAYVRDGILPEPEMIGNLQRWDFASVVSFIKARNNAPPHTSGDDSYIKGIRRAPTA
jgi:predicted DNA-binding transcriptional regulator AlpA